MPEAYVCSGSVLMFVDNDHRRTRTITVAIAAADVTIHLHLGLRTPSIVINTTTVGLRDCLVPGSGIVKAVTINRAVNKSNKLGP